MRYNQLAHLAQLSKTTDSRSSLNDDLNCWIGVVFDLTLFRQRMRVWLGVIPSKEPVTPENFIPIFQCNGKHFSDGIQPYRYFLWEFSSMLNAIFSYQHLHDLLPTHDRFQNDRYPKRESSWVLIVTNLFRLIFWSFAEYFCRYKWYFTFVRAQRKQYGGLDNAIEPDWRII